VTPKAQPHPTVRPARTDDSAELRALDHAAWSWLGSPAPRPTEDGDFFENIRPDDVLIAAVNGEIAAYVQFGAPTPLESNRHVLHITGLAVHPDHRGNGLGRVLVTAAAEEAASRGARRLTLRVLAPNEPARRIYEACGFHTEGVLKEEFLLEGRYVDDVLMALDLEAAGYSPRSSA
jgi:ribosomal protein S18 acetylase RimI-like enzyme